MFPEQEAHTNSTTRFMVLARFLISSLAGRRQDATATVNPRSGLYHCTTWIAVRSENSSFPCSLENLLRNKTGFGAREEDVGRWKLGIFLSGKS